MSCNGCRVLRKGCSENCILRPCLQWIERPEAQGHATVFVAKFFGRAGLMSFISAVPESQRPSLFQSLLFEACGRTVNPVNGAVGLLWTGNWHICQAAVGTVLRGGTLRPIPELLTGGSPSQTSDEASEICTILQNPSHHSRFSTSSRSKSSPPAPGKRRRSPADIADSDLDLHLINPNLTTVSPPRQFKAVAAVVNVNRPGTPSMNSDDSVATSCCDGRLESRYGNGDGNGDRKMLNLFV